MKKLFIINVMILLITVLSLNFVSADLTDGIVDYWSFDGGNYIGDLSKTGNNSGTTSVTGVVGTARLFTRASANYIAMNVNASYNNPTFSFCYFVKYGGAIANSNIPTIWKGQSTNKWYLWGYLDGATDTNTFYAYPAGTFDTITQNGAYITIPEVWENWCYTYNSSMVSIYKNATLTLNKTVATPISNDNEGLYFGKFTSSYFNGTMDEIVYWNRTITATEVQAYYNSIMNGTGYPFQGAIQSQIYANTYSGQQLKNFTIILTNGTTVTNYTTTNGSVYLPFYNNATQICNITINAFSPVSIINYTILNYNVSNTLMFNYTIYTIQNKNASSGNLFNATLSLSSSSYSQTMVNNLSDYFAWLYLDNLSIINITANLTGYMSNSTTLSDFGNGAGLVYNFTLYRGYAITAASYLDTYLSSINFQLTTFNVTVNNGSLVDNYSTTNGTVYTANYPSSNLYNVTILARNGSSIINFTIPNYNLQNPITFNYSISRIRTYDQLTNALLTNLSYTVLSSSMESISNITNGSFGFIMFNSNSTNTFTFGKNGYNTNSTTFPINLSGGFYDYNFTLTPNNTVLFRFFNASNGAAVTSSVTVAISDSNTTLSNTSSSGSAYIYNITPSAYNVLIVATGFNSYTSNVTVGNNTFQTFDAYLSGTSATSVTLTTKDNVSTSIVQGSVFIVENQINITSPWVLIGTFASDITGSVYINYNVGQFYRFTVSAPNYMSRQFNISPITQPAYDVMMTSNSSINVTNPYESVSLELRPTSIYNNQLNNFSLMVASPSGQLIYYNYSITTSYNTSILVTASGNNAYGSTLNSSLQINTSDVLATITVNYHYMLSNGADFNLTRTYTINEVAGLGTMFNSDSSNGMQPFDKVIIVLISAITVGGLITALSQNVAAGIFSLIIVFSIFLATGFLSVWISVPVIVLLFVGMVTTL